MDADDIPDLLEEWLFARLNDDETLRGLFTGEPLVHNGAVPATANRKDVREAVIFTHQSGVEDADRCGDFAGGRYVYAVKAVGVPGSGDYAEVRPLRKRIDARLRGVTFTVGDLTFTVSCEGPVRYREPDPNNQKWTAHSGGLYAFTVR